MANYEPLLALMGDVIEGVPQAEAILVGPCTQGEIDAMQRAIDAVVLTNPLVWCKHFTGSITIPETTSADIVDPLTAVVDAYRDEAGPLPIVFVPDAATLAALPAALTARMHAATPSGLV